MIKSNKKIETKKCVGRPTDLKKDSFIKIRIDSDTLKSIDDALKFTSQNRSEAIREILPSISSKNFETLISLGSLERLEKYTLDFEKLFESGNFDLELDTISENYPVFVFESENPILYIKYPTYKFRIISNIKYNDLSKILENVSGRLDITSTKSLLENSLSKEENSFKEFLEVICLKNNLKENENLKDEISSILDSKNINYELCPDYFVKGRNIKIEVKNDKKYICKL